MAPNVNTNGLMIEAINRLVAELEKANKHYSDSETAQGRAKAQSRIEQTNVTQQRAIRDYVSPPLSTDPGSFRATMGQVRPSELQQMLEENRQVPAAPTPYSYADFRQRLGQQSGGGLASRTAATLRTYANPDPAPEQQQPGDVSTTASMPPGQGLPGRAGGILASVGVDPHAAMSPGDPTSVLTTALLGEHGGPAFIRNASMESFALRRNLGWAQTHLSTALDPNQGGVAGTILNNIPGVSPQALQTVQGGLNLAMQHPLATYGAYRAVTGIAHGVGAINDNMTNWQQQGAQFGMDANNGALGGSMFLFGKHNPLSLTSDATQVGAGFAEERQRLQGRLTGPFGLVPGQGGGLSTAQAGETVQELAGQGFGADQTASGQGTNTQIAMNLVSPLLQQMRGLNPSDVTQFDPVLRNSGTSIQQLTDSLGNLDTAAQATHETVGQAAGSMAALQQSMHGLGSQQGALDIGRGFTAATGMDPQIAGQLAQNPIMQSQMLQQGILPSGIADANPGTFNTAAMSTIQMLQHATQGFNRNRYTTINGQRVLTQSGSQAQVDQIAQMSGLDPNVVKRYMGDAPGITARQTLTTGLGGSQAGTGLYSLLNNHASNQQLEKYWNTVIQPNWKGTGISQQQMQQLQQTPDFHHRAQLLTADLNRANQRDRWNQVSTNPNAQTVNVQFTGQAAKMFQVAGVTPAKAASNAAQGPAINGVVNTPVGDPYNASAIVNAANGVTSGFRGG